MIQHQIERRRNIGRELDRINDEIKKLKDLDVEANAKIEELQRGHAAIQRDLASNTATTVEIKHDTAQLISLVKGTQTGIRWGGRVARGSYHVAKWVAAAAAAGAIIKYGFIDVIHWLKTL